MFPQYLWDKKSLIRFISKYLCFPELGSLAGQNNMEMVPFSNFHTNFAYGRFHMFGVNNNNPPVSQAVNFKLYHHSNLAFKKYIKIIDIKLNICYKKLAWYFKKKHIYFLNQIQINSLHNYKSFF